MIHIIYKIIYTNVVRCILLFYKVSHINTNIIFMVQARYNNNNWIDCKDYNANIRVEKIFAEKRYSAT